MEKFGGAHSTRRTAAMASLNVGSDLLYHAATFGRSAFAVSRARPRGQRAPWHVGRVTPHERAGEGALAARLRVPTPERLWAAAEALRRGWEPGRVSELY